jgi:hypothetical protein
MRRHHPDQPDLVEADAAALKTDAAAEEFIRLIVDGFPPLTAEQRARLAVLTRRVVDAGDRRVAAECGVGPVMVVGVQPAWQGGRPLLI